MTHYFTHSAKRATPIVALTISQFQPWLKRQHATTQAWVKANIATPKADTALLVPDAKGNVSQVIAITGDAPTIWSLAHLPAALPAGTYSVDTSWNRKQLADAALGFALAQYQFTAYRKAERKALTLVLPKSIDIDALEERAEAIYLARDLINAPTNDMLPSHLAAAARKVAKEIDASFSVIVGDNLLKKNYPAIHAVGRASTDAPRLIDLKWGNPKHPKLTLVGKGVCFDTGGLDIKPYASMKLMKKDMGGAALVLALAKVIAAEKLPVRLRVLIPAVENSIAGNAFRPQDIIQTRKGLSMEIGSTDAEGRVILCDALSEADSENPDLIIDAATLTGAARTALGAELPALYSNDDGLAKQLQNLSLAESDPMWHMPLWAGYDKYVNSPIADVTNTPNYGFAGSITAALFLNRFVRKETPWIHLDTYAWNAESQAGRPAGGEALGIRALLALLKARYQ
ncbi:MAG: leucyl aminopeptidase family protein [Alphaproteobacteria bacterium]|nr:leucyl aminopeptidase family protein [Alphaproteobacteria bacterium]